MRSINAIDYIATPDTGAAPTKVRRASWGKESLIFTDIYQEDINIVTWQRDLAQSLKDSVSEFLVSNPGFQSTLTVTPQSALSDIQKAFGSVDQSILVENIAELVDIFCSLFEISHAGLRLSALDRAMCPKFHVDKVPCRLVTTFQGVATQWLPHHAVDRTKLGLGSNGLPDKESGLYQRHDDIQQLSCGDVALLKGEVWYNNENAGLVHRSPALSAGENRLLLTLDFAN
ncbi:MAG: DUF1826 domain-containing protein [Arenicella sp.]